MSAMTTKAFVDQAANMATMCAFTIPVYGPAIAAGIAVGTGLFNLIVPSLDEKTPSGMQSLNKQDLQNAVDELRDAISDALFNDNVDNASTWIINFNSDQLLANIAKAKDLGLDKKSLFFPQDLTTAQTVKALEQFFGPDARTLQDLLDNRDVLTRSSANDKNLSPSDLAAHRTNTTALYCFAGSAIVLYLKTAIAWKWAEEILYCNAYKNWHAEMKVWNGRNAAYRRIHPEQDPDLKYPGVSKYSHDLPTWQDWCKNGLQLKLMENNIKELLNYSIRDEATGKDGLYTVMVKNWNARMKSTSLVAKNYSDAFDAKAVFPIVSYESNSSRDMKECQKISALWNEVDLGVKLLETWDSKTNKYALEQATYEDLTLYHNSIVKWQDALEEMRFQTVIARDNDTPKKVAARVYRDASLFTKLLDANDNPFVDGGVDLTGMRVKAPELNPNRIAMLNLPDRQFQG